MRPWLKGLLAGLATSVAGVLLVLTPLGAEFEQNVGLAWLFKLRGPIHPPKDVVVVAIDDQTGAHLGVSNLPREWARALHGRLVDNLTRRGAAAIAFDFDFQLPKTPADDAAFATAIAESGRVVLAEKLLGKRQPILDSQGAKKGSVWMEQLISPAAPLAAAAKGLGTFPLPKVQVAVHEFWVFKPSIGDAPTLPAVALQIGALSAYRHLRKLATTLDPADSAGLPQPLEDSARAAELRSFMIAVRRAFTKQPELGMRLAQGLDAQGAAALPPAERLGVRALLGLYSGGDHRVLNFYGPPGSITTIPYHRVAAADAADAPALPDLTGKTVFVGFSDLYDPGQPDRFYTVFTNEDGVDLSGVEIAATGFANLQSGRHVQPIDPWSQVATLVVAGCVMGLTAFLLPAVAGVPLVILMATGYVFGAVRAFSTADLWMPLATPLLVQLPLALFVGLIAQYLSERHKKTQARRAISLYLPEHLARLFTENNLDSSVLNRVTHSVCFASDMAGFTTIAEKLRPKELAAFLNDYFEHLSEPLRRHKVDVIEFRADGIMCAWTSEQPEVAIRRSALEAALDAIQTMARYKDAYALLSQSLRIGLETGSVFVGHAGGGGHFVYSIVGDCANTAARIEGLNKQLGTQLLASGAALEGVDGLVTRFLGEFRFVGKTEVLPIFEVLDREILAGDAVKILCTRFAGAMAVLQTGQWGEACELFEALQHDYPEDGPTRFHVERCRRQVDTAPAHPPWIVHLDTK